MAAATNILVVEDEDALAIPNSQKNASPTSLTSTSNPRADSFSFNTSRS